MFDGATAFVQPLPSWRLTKALDTGRMFARTSWNNPVNQFEFTQLVRCNSMFEQNTVFNQPLDLWNFSTVKFAHMMLQGTRDFNQNLDSWNT